MREKPKELSKILERIPEEWGKVVRCDKGWYSIILDLDMKIGRLDPDYMLYQVKEKFGGLRYYCSNEDKEEVFKLIDEACMKACKTCELCGGEGRLHQRELNIKTLCDNCAKEKGYVASGGLVFNNSQLLG